jgi:hypothetical protein
MTNFILLNDPGSQRQWLIRGEHVCAAEVRREDGVVLLHLLNGQEVLLTHEESKQFVRHTRPLNARKTARARRTTATGARAEGKGSP